MIPGDNTNEIGRSNFDNPAFAEAGRGKCEAEINLLLGDVCHDAEIVHRMDGDPHLWARLAKKRDSGRHKIVCKRWRRCDVNRADLLVAHIFDQPVDAIDAFEDPVEIGDQHAGFRSGLQTALTTDEQWKSGNAATLTQQHADGWLGDAERYGCPGYGTPLADGANDLELTQRKQHKLSLS